MNDDYIYLTFDDGPHPVYTPLILDILAREKIQATFFVVGDRIDNHKDIIDRIKNDGHSIGFHTQHHKSLRQLPLISMFSEICAMKKGIDYHGTSNAFKLFRPPYGELTLSALISLLLFRIKIVLWSIDSADSTLSCENKIIKNIFSKKIVAGDIILFHDDEEHTPIIVGKVIQRLKQNKFKFMNLSG